MSGTQPEEPASIHEHPVGSEAHIGGRDDQDGSASSEEEADGSGLGVAVVIQGDFDSGSLDAFSRMVTATGGRRVMWKVRDEQSSLLRRMLNICGEIMVGFLGVEPSNLVGLILADRTGLMLLLHTCRIPHLPVQRNLGGMSCYR